MDVDEHLHWLHSACKHVRYTGISKKKWISWKRSIFFVTHFRIIRHREIFQAFISWHLDDYGLQIMKTQNSVSQKIRILHKINKKAYFKQKCQASENCSFLCTQYLVEPLFAWITASMRRDMEVISLWHCSGVMESQVALIAAFGSSALLGMVSHLPLDNYP